MTTPRHTLALLLLLGLAACRADPGPNPYGDQENFLDDEEDVFLEGPDPYEGAEPRLDIGVFYEGGSSEQLTVDGVSRHYYVYQDEFTGIDTFGQELASDRIEGIHSDRVVVSGNPWWGGGIHWDSPRDMTPWGTLHVHLKSADPSFEALQLAMESDGGGVGLVAVADYGFASDDQWHGLEIPLSAYRDQGVDLSMVSIVLRFDGVGGEAGESLLIDNLYFTR